MPDLPARHDGDALSDETIHLRPLTPRADGVVPYRYDDVTQQIRSALSGGKSLLVMRATMRDLAAAHQGLRPLKEESLVYLIRAFQFAERGSDGQRKEVVDGLSRELSLRCSPTIRFYMQRNYVGWDAEEAFSRAHSRVFELVLSPGKTVSDYLEINFWKALTRIKQKARDDMLKKYAEQQATVSLSDSASFEIGDADGGDLSLQALQETLSTPEEAALLREKWVAGQQLLLSIVNPQHREAFIMRHGLNFPMGQKNSGEGYIAGHFKRTPQTIRQWLEQAETDIEAAKKEGLYD